jgi:hypothetical protein
MTHLMEYSFNVSLFHNTQKKTPFILGISKLCKEWSPLGCNSRNETYAFLKDGEGVWQ